MASTNTLTDKAIRAALKAAAEGGNPIRISDGAGLHLEARPTGAGWWRLRYRFGGKEGMLSMGTYPETGLAAARKARDAARARIVSGINPSEAKKADKAAAKAQVEVQRLVEKGEPVPGTFEAVAREWLTTVHKHRVTAGHADRTRIRLEQMIFPWLGARPVSEIEPPDLLQCLRRIEGRGAIETAHRVKDSCGQVFRFGVAAGYCQRNPAADLRDALRPVPSRHHAAITDPAQFGELLRAIAEYKGTPLTTAALRLSALLLLRPGELRHIEWGWLDLDGATLTVPAMAMKRRKADKQNGVPHLVPLAHQAVEIFRRLQPLTGAGKFVFPSLHGKDRPMSENTVNVALRRLGFDREQATAHGFRASARTMLVERLGVLAEVIEAQLAHAVPDALGRAYNRTTFIEQRVEAMQQWADYIDRLRDGAEVIRLPTRAA